MPKRKRVSPHDPFECAICQALVRAAGYLWRQKRALLKDKGATPADLFVPWDLVPRARIRKDEYLHEAEWWKQTRKVQSSENAESRGLARETLRDHASNLSHWHVLDKVPGESGSMVYFKGETASPALLATKLMDELRKQDPRGFLEVDGVIFSELPRSLMTEADRMAISNLKVGLAGLAIQYGNLVSRLLNRGGTGLGSNQPEGSPMILVDTDLVAYHRYAEPSRPSQEKDPDQELVAACDTALNRLITEFKAAPLVFFSEKDVHWRFCTHFREVMAARGIDEKVRNKDGQEVSLIHQEYGSMERDRTQTDVVVLPPSQACSSTGVPMSVGDQFYSRPLVALEFGTEKSESAHPSDGRIDLRHHTARDLEKLKRSKAVETRLVIFYRDDEVRQRDGRLERLRTALEVMSLDYPQTRVILAVPEGSSGLSKHG